MRGLDLFLRARFYGPIAWWIERRFGYSKFAIARTCVYASQAMSVVYFGVTWRNSISALILIGGPILMWFYLAAMQLHRWQRDEYLARTHPDIHMHIEDTVWPLRMIQLGLFSGFDAFVLGLDLHYPLGWMWLVAGPCRAYMTLFASGAYFVSVPAPPPKKEKERAPTLVPVPHAG